MAVFADRLADDLYAHTYGEFGQSAEYRLIGGASSTACSLILEESASSVEVDDSRRVGVRRAIGRVRASEIAAPVIRATFTVGSDAWRVVDDPQRVRGEWVMNLEVHAVHSRGEP